MRARISLHSGRRVRLLAAATTKQLNAKPTKRSKPMKEEDRKAKLEEIQQFFASSPEFLWVDLTGGEVTLRKDIGSTEVIDKELQSGRIDAYPEYLGVAVTVA